MITGDEAFAFELAHALDDRRCGQPNLLADLGERRFAVSLQQGEDAPVDLVQPKLVATRFHEAGS